MSGWYSADVATELGVAQAAVGEALDALRRAGVLAWESAAGDAFRDRLDELAVGLRHDDAALHGVRNQTAQLEVTSTSRYAAPSALRGGGTPGDAFGGAR